MKPKRVTLSLRLPAKLHRALQREAKRRDLPLSAYIRALLLKES